VEYGLVDLTAVGGKNMLKIAQISSLHTAHQNSGVFKRKFKSENGSIRSKRKVKRFPRGRFFV